MVAFASCDVESKEFAQVQEALANVHSIIQKNPSGRELSNSMQELKAAISYAPISAGILYWLRLCFMDIEYFSTTYKNTLQLHVELLEEITVKHPLQHSIVFTLMLDCFEMNPSSLDPLSAVRKNCCSN
jgi:hypothetical protein